MNKIIKKLILLSVLLVLVTSILLTGCTQKTDSNKDKVKLRLKWIMHSQFAGYFTAEQKGFYEQNGIDVEIIPGGAESPSIQMVASGSEHFGITGMGQLMEARAKGVPIVALATIYRKNPLIWFSVNSNITTAQDLVGKKVGVTIGSNSDILFRAMLKKAGVDINQVETLPVTYDISSLLVGKIDAYEGYMINQPLSARENGFETYIINPTDYGINFYGDTLFTTEEMIEKNPDLVRRFVKASIEGWEYAYDNPDEAVTYTMMYNDQLKREHETGLMQISLDLIRPDDKPIGTIERSVLEEMHELLISNDILDKPINIDELYTTEFLE